MNEVRLHVLRTAMETTKVPSAVDIAAGLGISRDEAIQAYRELGEAHVYVLEPGDPSRLRMANPFSAVPTAFQVRAAGKRYYGNCIWDGLGVVSLIDGTGELATRCSDCGADMRLVVSRQELVHKEGVVHFSVPAAHWWDDIIYS